MCVYRQTHFLRLMTVGNGLNISVDRHMKEFVDLQMFGMNVVEDLAVAWYIILM